MGATLPVAYALQYARVCIHTALYCDVGCITQQRLLGTQCLQQILLLYELVILSAADYNGNTYYTMHLAKSWDSHALTGVT